MVPARNRNHDGGTYMTCDCETTAARRIHSRFRTTVPSSASPIAQLQTGYVPTTRATVSGLGLGYHVTGTMTGMRGLAYAPHGTTTGMRGLGDLEPLPGALAQFNRARSRVGNFGRSHRYSHVQGLGRFGETTTTGQVVGSAAGTVAGAETGAAIGTAVFPGFGTAVGAVVGAVVGIITSKLFGKANQGQILNDVTTRMKYADAYKALPPGTYPGRYITAPDLLMIWYGLLHEGYFPQAEQCGGAVLHASLCPPQYPACNCGAETWANGMVNGTDVYEFPAIIAKALAGGQTNPITIVNSYILPGIQNLSDGSKNAHWAIPSNTTNPALITQLYVDIVDAYLASKNANTPIYYGNANAAQALTASGVPAPASVATPPQITGSGAIIPQVQAGPQVARPVASPSGATLNPGSGGTLTDAAGNTFQFGGPYQGSPDYTILVNGAANGAAVNLSASDAVYARNFAGAIYKFYGGAWSQISGPTPSTAGTTIQGATGATLQTSYGTVSANGDGSWALNGHWFNEISKLGGQIDSMTWTGSALTGQGPAGTYTWNGSAWTLTQAAALAPTTVQPTTPAANLSPNNSQITPASGGTLTTAQGTWSFAPNGMPELNGQISGNAPWAPGLMPQALAILNGTPTVLDSQGATWGWNGSAWTQLTPPTSSLATGVTPAAPTSIYSQPGFSTTGYSSPIAPTPITPVDTSGQPSAVSAPPGTVAAATVGSGTLLSGPVITAIGVVAAVVTLGMAVANRKKAGRARR